MAEVEEEVPWSAFLEDSPKFLGDGRIRTKMNTSAASGALLSYDGWHDTRLETECSSWTAADGKYRCVPGPDQTWPT